MASSAKVAELVQKMVASNQTGGGAEFLSLQRIEATHRDGWTVYIQADGAMKINGEWLPKSGGELHERCDRAFIERVKAAIPEGFLGMGMHDYSMLFEAPEWTSATIQLETRGIWTLDLMKMIYSFWSGDDKKEMLSMTTPVRGAVDTLIYKKPGDEWVLDMVLRDGMPILTYTTMEIDAIWNKAYRWME
jgi:hypothetical protein